MYTMSNLDKRWHGSDLISVQHTKDHTLIWWRQLMPLPALSRIKYNDYIITLYGELYSYIRILRVD